MTAVHGGGSCHCSCHSGFGRVRHAVPCCCEHRRSFTSECKPCGRLSPADLLKKMRADREARRAAESLDESPDSV